MMRGENVTMSFGANFSELRSLKCLDSGCATFEVENNRFVVHSNCEDTNGRFIWLVSVKHPQPNIGLRLYYNTDRYESYGPWEPSGYVIEFARFLSKNGF